MGILAVFHTFLLLPDEGPPPFPQNILYLNNTSRVQSYIHPADLLSLHIRLQLFQIHIFPDYVRIRYILWIHMQDMPASDGNIHYPTDNNLQIYALLYITSLQIPSE